MSCSVFRCFEGVSKVFRSVLVYSLSKAAIQRTFDKRDEIVEWFGVSVLRLQCFGVWLTRGIRLLSVSVLRNVK